MMQASVETIETMKGRQESQRCNIPRVASNCKRDNDKYGRKHSQTFTRRQNHEWEPTRRRYSVETDHQLQRRHKQPRRAEHQHHDSSLGADVHDKRSNEDIKDTASTLQEHTRLQLRTATATVATEIAANRITRRATSGSGGSGETSHPNEAKSDASIRQEVGLEEDNYEQQQRHCRVATDQDRLENVKGNRTEEEACRPAEVSCRCGAIERPLQSGQNLRHAAKTAASIKQNTAAGRAVSSCNQSSRKNGSGRNRDSKSVGQLNRSAATNLCPSHDLTGRTDHQSELATCCPSHHGTGTSSSMALNRKEQLHEQTVVPAAGQCASAAEKALTVDVNEKLQMHDRQRKHVILSMALKQLISDNQDVPTVVDSPGTDLDKECVCRSGSCNTASSVACKSSSRNREMPTATKAITAKTTTITKKTTDNGGDNLSSLNECQDVDTDKRFHISEKLTEAASLLFLNTSLENQTAATTKAFNLIKISQDQDGLQAARTYLASKNINEINHQATRKDFARPESHQHQRQLKSMNSTGGERQQQLNSIMRHLVTSTLAAGELPLNQGGCSSPSDSCAGDSFDRPRSTVLLDCQLDKLGFKTANNTGSEYEDGCHYHRMPMGVAGAAASSSTPTRHSYSAFGQGNINCDSLVQSASNQCDTNIEALIVESWLDDHPAFAHDYFIRKAPRQLIDDWLVANARISNTSLRGSQFDLCSPSSISRPISQQSLNGPNLRGPAWIGSASMLTHDQDDCEHQHQRGNLGFVRANRSNSQSAASTLSSCKNSGATTPIRKISATDFETRSGSGFLRPMLSKTPDGRFSFLPHSSALASPVQHQQQQDHSSATMPTGRADANQSNAPPRSLAQVSLSAGAGCKKTTGQPLMDDIELMTTYSDSSNTSTLEPNERRCSNNNDDDGTLVGRGPNHGVDKHLDDPHHEISLDEAPDESEVKMIFELVKNIYDDLDIRTLLHKILKNIAALINADRSSLFLVCGGPNDPNRRLVSQLFNVDQDSTEVGEAADEPITIPWGTGLVGYVAESGEAVNITDCYRDPRFTDAIDQRTGYVTRHMLCAPILDKRNEIVGVAQVINKRDGNAFSKNDEIKFKRYLQFCGIGLRNAQSYEQCQLENRRNQVLLDLARMVFEEQSTIEQVVHRIMLHTQSLLDCERCQVLLIDSGNDELEGLLQMPNARNLINCQSSNSNVNNNNNDDSRGVSTAVGAKAGKRTPEDRHPDWRPQCRSKDDTGGPASRPSPSSPGDRAAATAADIQLPQAPRLFSLVFDLECDGNDYPVVYDSRRADGALSSSAMRSGSNRVELRRARAFPMNIGITGYVASTGETLNIENAHEHERFDASVDDGSDFKHRSILCMPIRNGQRQIIGVIQLINKKNGQPFNKNDEDLFEAFAIFCGLGIHNTLMYERVLKVMAKQRVTFEVLSYHATAPLEEAKRLSQEQIPSCFALNLASLKFNDFSLDDQYMLKSCLRFFLDLDLIRRFQIDQLVFCNWILSVQKNYRKVTYHPIVGGNGLKASPVRYHNWRHAFNVSQMMFAILVNTQICQSLGELETLALLIACLCHDLDHRGTNNSFQIKSASPLAELYSTSTMEHHHFDQCVMILNSQGNQILSNLSPQEYSRVIMLLEEAILATDLANYFGKRDHFFQLINSDSLDWRNDPSHRSLLRCMLMTACDIAAITKPWPVQKVVADLVMSEFYQQGDIERNELKIEPIDMMNRDKMSELPSMQIGFIDSICAPIYTAFARLFPQQLHTLIDGCLANRNLWQELAESNTKPEIPVINYLTCDNDGPIDNGKATKLLPTNVGISKSEISLPSQLLESSNGDNRERTNSGGEEVDHVLSSEPTQPTCKLALSSIGNKLAETGLSARLVGVQQRHDSQRRSI